MKNDFEVAVLIPVKGYCEFLTATLESVCESTITPKEVIIVDDGIAESTRNVINKFSSKLNITLLPNRGEGIVAALNTGLNHCTYQFVARLDADDLVTSNRFELQINKMLSNSEIAVLGGQLNFIDSNGQKTGSGTYESGRLDLTNRFRKQCMVAHPATMIRTAMALQVSGYRTVCTDGRIDFAEDFDLWLRISRIGQIHNLNEVVLLYRQHGAQVSQVHAQNQFFATAYVSMINEAKLIKPEYRFKILVIRKYSFDFLINLFKSIPKFGKIIFKLHVIVEGLLIFFGVTNKFVLRAIRRILNSAA